MNTSATLWFARTMRQTLLVSGVALTSVASAQVSSSGATSDSGSLPAEDPIVLSPFVVDTSGDVGYLAGNTLAGSRFNTSLKDTPASISVLTSEFLSDLGAFDISEALAYGVNVEFDLDDDRVTVNGNSTINNYQSYRVRGLPASVSQNYFKWNLPAESALLDRIEDSRGPNSVLFGIASPGGLINSMTKQAMVERAFREVSTTAGSHDSFRTTLDINQPLLANRLAVRLNAVYNNTKSFRHYQYQSTSRVHLAGTFVVDDQTRIRVEAEKGEIDSNQPRAANLTNRFLLWDSNGRSTYDSATPNESLGVSRLPNGGAVPRFTFIENDGATISMRGTLTTNNDGPWGDGPILDTAIADKSINVGGLAQDRFSEFEGISAYLERQFGEKTFLEIAYNHQQHQFDRYDPRSGPPQALTGDPNNFRLDGSANPYAQQLYLEGHWFRTYSDDRSDTWRTMLSTELDFDKWGNYRIAGMGEYIDSLESINIWREQWKDAATGLPAQNLNAPENVQNSVWRRTYVTEGDWASYRISGPGPGGTGLLSNVTEALTGRTLYSDWVANAPRESDSVITTAMAALQARYFNDRLVIAAGYRRDELDLNAVPVDRDPVTNERRFFRELPLEDVVDVVAETKTLGSVFHVTPWFSLHYNQSDNVSLPENLDRLPPSGEPGNPIPLGPPSGEGRDYGAAVTLLDGRLYARATYFTTKAVDQSTTSPPGPRNANTRILDALLNEGLISQAERDFRNEVGIRGVFDFASEGVEFQLTANATEDWRFQMSYSYTDAVEENLFLEWKLWHEINLAYLSQFDINNIVTGEGRTIAQEIDFYLNEDNGLIALTQNDGLSKLGNRPHKVNFFTRYNVSSGPLKGIYVGGGYRYQGEMFTGIVSRQDRTEIWAPGYGQADFLLGYTFPKMSNDGRLSAQLNLYNVFDETDRIITRYNVEGGTRIPSVALPRDGRTWRLTMTYKF